MSDDETGGDELTVESLRERLEAVEAALEDAETEADLDEVEAALEDLESDVEATLEDDEDDEEAEELEDELGGLADELDEARGPYAEDVLEDIEAVSDEIDEETWTEQGEASLRNVVETALEEINGILGTSLSLADDDELTEKLLATLEATGAAIDDANLDPDEDGDTIESLLEATETLQDGVDDAQTWDDLSVRQQLQAQGYYDVLDHVKDFPPEWHALKVHEKRGNIDMVLLALETFDSDFMEEHALEALERMGHEDGIEPMLQRAGRRDQDAIRILGKTGVEDEEVVETLVDYVDNDNNPLLQKVTFKALGQIGTEAAVQPIADQLVAENAEIRSGAARALGLIGDTRAIDPLADVLAEDNDDTARASAAWALNQIATEAALEAVAEYTDDRAYLVQAEAEKAAPALEPAA
ncbi:HEAT repeat domain-containing protein [Halobacteria archaeon AArc-curdl1]|uniref:HEAT repeat domain-containing protein n=1 Tax=Natronosalvus hydrolyticus TaxID=2979988 RepID=A0AAP2Z5D0_9EURY|nr:HEAT repeat domain-containing protein [Halobacteria archaeon AArc-curdl1]